MVFVSHDLRPSHQGPIPCNANIPSGSPSRIRHSSYFELHLALSCSAVAPFPINLACSPLRRLHCFDLLCPCPGLSIRARLFSSPLPRRVSDARSSGLWQSLLTQSRSVRVAMETILRQPDAWLERRAET